MPNQKSTTSLGPWESAAKLKVMRTNPVFGGVEKVDPGANFFVLALEAMGATTRFSCEGHPTGFYVSFEAPYELAIKIKSAGFFTVEIEGENHWSMRKIALEFVSKQPYSELNKAQDLRWAAEAWMESFGENLMQSDGFAAVLDAGLEADGSPMQRKSTRLR